MAITINQEPTTSGYQINQTEPDSNSVLNTTGQDGSNFLSRVLGFEKANSFYTDFYNNLLTTGNAPPINSLWLVFIQDIPATGTILNTQNGYQIKDGATSFGNENFQKAANEGRRTRGVILAQGVKHTGDGSNFSREGYSNTGLWKGVLSNGRSDIQTLDISFLESNISFVDYALRPWAISVAHRGLTNPELYANNITVWHLSKMGAGANFKRRKVIKYHNCFPINIDQQEYNYAEDNMDMKRVVSFGYHYYTLEDADANVLDLLSYTSSERGILGQIKGYLKNQTDSAFDTLKSSLGANSVSQYLNNIVERGQSFADSLITNTIQGAVTNFAGTVQDAVDGAIRDFTSDGLRRGNEVVTGVAERTNEAVNRLIGNDPNADTVNGVNINLVETPTDDYIERNVQNASYDRLESHGYVERSVNPDDAINKILPKMPNEELASAAEVNTDKQINQNDTPDNSANGVTNNLDGSITISREKSEGNPNADTPNFLGSPTTNLLNYIEKKVSTDDVPTYANGLKDSIPNNGFRTALDESNIRNDSTSKQVNVNDGNPSISTRFNQVNTNRNDGEVSNNITYKQVNIKQNDSDASNNVSYVNKRVSENDAL